MPSTLTKDNTYLIKYNIPRIVIGSVGRQNRSGDGVIRITPGMAEPFRFLFGNNDGRPINLNNMIVHLVVWCPKNYDQDSLVMENDTSELIVKKAMDVIDPYQGEVFVMLDGHETSKIHSTVKSGSLSARWTVLMTNPEGDMFPSQVSSSGSRYGSVLIEDLDLPPLDIVMGS